MGRDVTTGESSELPRYSPNCVAPGMMATPMNAESYNERDVSGYAATIPLGRIGQPEEIAEVAGLLASDRASFVTGQVWNACGGLISTLAPTGRVTVEAELPLGR